MNKCCHGDYNDFFWRPSKMKVFHVGMTYAIITVFKCMPAINKMY